MIPLGKVEKMTIWTYADASCEGTPLAGPYKFLINPENYNHSFEIDLEERRPAGGTETSQVYFGPRSGEWEFEILIDGTGIIRDPSVLDITLLGITEEINVVQKVDELKTLVLDSHEELHRNQYLKVVWGEEVFKGSLYSMDLQYKLFKPNGTPLRVIAKMKLKEWTFSELAARNTNASSPDITHERVIKPEDKFSLMSKQVYNDVKYYIDVAQKNDLNSFRRIESGTRLQFPAIK